MWFISRDRKNANYRNRENEILFIDARNMGEMITRRNRDFSDEDIARIADTYHAWRNKDGEYEDETGFSKAASLEEVLKHNHVLTPGRYVGIPDEEDDESPFHEKWSI
ncbi:MAG: N-6 DNA methylase [Halioglobus sp.]|nr:N-6 DNA methylase [Halioglobus sp.]